MIVKRAKIAARPADSCLRLRLMMHLLASHLKNWVVRDTEGRQRSCLGFMSTRVSVPTYSSSTTALLRSGVLILSYNKDIVPE